MLLNQGFFQDQGFDFVFRNDEVNVINFGAHAQRLAIAIGDSRKITADAIAQALGLAHIDDPAPAVLQQVNAGLGGQILENGFDVLWFLVFH